MSVVKWDFPLLGSGNEQGYTNSGIELFKGVELIENLAREICQNSLDAKDDDVSEPVKVVFEIATIKANEHEIFSEFAKCVSGCKRYWGTRMDDRLKSFLRVVDKTMCQDEISVLLARDYNTKGLTGAKASRDEVSVWRALAHSDGTSVNKQGDSAGSYGIGKNAPFACSNLSMVFYSTYAKDGIHAFQGVSRLATILDENGNPTQGTGHYLCVENNNEWHPIFPQDKCSLRDAFPRDEYGTDIIIIGFNGDSSWEEAMIQAVLSNFFLAIHENKMMVRIQGCDINAATIAGLIEERKDSNNEMRNTHEWYSALTEPDDNTIIYCSVLEENDAELYIRADNQYHNYVASFRPTGMRVRKYRKAIMQHFAAVVVIRGKKLSCLLRDTEPPRHNRWDYKLITDNKQRRKMAKKALTKLDSWVLAELQKKYEAVNEYTIDSGEGDYLPDDIDNISESQIGDDILRVNQKIADIVTIDPLIGTMQSGSRKGTGIPKDGHIYEKKKRKSKKKRRKVVVKSGDTPGMKPSPDEKPLSTVNITEQRVFAVNPQLGLYRVLVKSDKDYDKVYFTFSAVGEDESEDALEVVRFAIDGKPLNNSGTTIGPIFLEKDTMKELFVTFANKEKMLLDVVAKEVK